MRRFEFREGASHKFWCIELSRETFKVVYGRIGTDGREQTKTFESEEIAVREAAKLVRAKTKKGYVEVGAATSLQAAARAVKAKSTATKTNQKEKAKTTKPAMLKPESSAAPESATSVDYSAPFLAWTDDLQKRVIPHRGSEPPSRAKSAIKPKTVFKLGIAGLESNAAHWAAGEVAAKPTGKELLVRVRARLAGEEPTAFDADLEAGCVLISHAFADWTKGAQIYERAVRFWGQKYGALAAAQALVRCTQIRFIGQNAERKPAPRLHVPASTKSLDSQWNSHPWEALRVVFAFAPEAEYEEARTWLRAWASDFKPSSRQFVCAAFVLSEDADLRTAALEANPRGWGYAGLVTNAEEAKRVLDRKPYYILYKHVLTLISRVGLDALPLLLAHPPSEHDIDSGREWVRALSVFAGVGPAKAMAAFLGAKSVRPMLAKYLERHPELGLAVLPDIIKATKKKAAREAAKAMLLSLESASDAPSAEELGPIAKAESLPEVLQAPPWRSKRKAAAAVNLSIAPLELPAELALSESERNTLTKRARQGYTRPLSANQFEALVQGFEPIDTWQLGRIEDDDDLLNCIAALSKTKRWRWSDAETIRGFVARLGTSIAPHVHPMITEPESVVGLEDLGVSNVAPLMAAAAFRAKTKRTARRWLFRFPDHAAAGLLPDAFGADKKSRKIATAALRLLVQSGKGEVLVSVAQKFGAEALKHTESLVDMDPLLDAPRKAPKLPPWVDLGRLPRPRLKSGEALSNEATKYIVEMLVFSEADPPYAGLETVAAALDDDSANEFARGLCSAWAAAGAKPIWKWAAHSLGHLGNDESARWLVGQINAWASDGSKSVALAGLDALGMMGSNVALMPLARWSRRARPWLKTGAQQLLQAIAEQRELSPDELEDQTAPTLGLDDKGGLTLDYGPRRFFVRFDEHLLPRIRNEEGEVVAKIPPVRKTDNEALAKAAKKTWAALKKDADALSKGQVERLERAMTSKRSWSVEEFETHLVRHPLVGHLVRRLVFVHERGGKKVPQTFRVGEELHYANADDDACDVSGGGRVRIVHPVHLESDELALWVGVFSDYEILQPFAQLGRVVHRPKPGDAGKQELGGAAGIAAYTGRIFALKNRGWVLGGDPYSMDSASKEIAPGVSASISWEEGIELERPKMQEHKIRQIRIYGELTLDELDALTFSELVMDVESLRSGVP